MKRATILHGDCLETLPTLEANSVDTVVTDPPYGLSFMGKAWDHGVPGAVFWREVLRVAKPGAFMFAFGGTRTYHRLTCAIEDAGWEIRDCMMWLYGTGFPKSLDVSKAIDKAAGAERESTGQQVSRGAAALYDHGRGMAKSMGFRTAPTTDLAHRFDGYGTALKPAHEPIVVAMKPMPGTFAQNAAAYDLAGLHIDGGRIASGSDYHSLNGLTQGARGSRTSFRVTHAERQFEPASGRWPANVLLTHDARCNGACHPECPVAGVDAQSGEGVSRTGGKSGTTFSAGVVGQVRLDPRQGHTGSGGASRFFYTSKASRTERGESNTHPTVKPLAILRYLCKLSKPPGGGVVLDPFMGSGSTLLAALAEGRRVVGIEKEEQYCNIARARIGEPVTIEQEAKPSPALYQTSLFP
jgi:site-specific DNA-methyltransferase (adenine-specific)